MIIECLGQNYILCVSILVLNSDLVLMSLNTTENCCTVVGQFSTVVYHHICHYSLRSCHFMHLIVCYLSVFVFQVFNPCVLLEWLNHCHVFSEFMRCYWTLPASGYTMSEELPSSGLYFCKNRKNAKSNTFTLLYTFLSIAHISNRYIFGTTLSSNVRSIHLWHYFILQCTHFCPSR